MADITLGPVARIGATEVRTSTARRSTAGNTNVAQNAAAIAPSRTLDAGSAPIDVDRVSTIRRAIAQGHYPLTPTKIGDAMIAAGILLRSPTV
jgi:negative regulator of flagellin synthesis FlgM